MREDEGSTITQTSVLLQHNRYRRILKRRVTKTLQEIFFKYFNYIFTTAAATKLVINVFRVLSILQIMAAALQIMNESIYGTSSTMSKIFKVFSVIVSFNIFNLAANTYSIVVLVVCLICLITFIYIYITTYYFHVQSKLSHFSVTVIAVFLGCVMPFMIYCTMTYIAMEIDALINVGKSAIRIANIVICVITFGSCFSFYSIIVPSNLNFRASVHGIFFIKDLQIFLFATSYSILASEIGCHLNRLPGDIIAITAIIGDIIAFLITLRTHVWLSDFLKRFYQGMFIVNIVYRILIPVLSIANVKGNEAIVISYLALIFIVLIIAPMLERRSVLKDMTLLDTYQGADFFEEHKHKDIVRLFKVGFFHGHPILHNWTFIQDALLRYPNDRAMTILYARFSAIYPDEIENVRDSIIKLIAIKKHDIECKKLLNDLQTLLQLRERNLTKGLKKQLNKAKERYDKCIAQARRIWECVIRGSTTEVNSLSNQLQALSKDVAKEYSQLLLVYPNNPFVARAYSQFLESVVCDLKQANDYHGIYQSLKAGKQLHVEKGYFFAITEIPTLPIDKDHSFINQQKNQANNPEIKIQGVKSTTSFLVGGFSTSSTGELHGEFGSGNREISQEHQYVEHAIQSVRLPSVVTIKILIIIMSIIVILLTTVPYLILIPKQMSTNINSAMAIRFISEMYVNILHIMTNTIQFVGSSNGKFLSVKERYISISGQDGFPYTDEEILDKSIEALKSNTANFEMMLPTMKDSGYYTDTLNLAFNTTGPIKIYFGPNTTPGAPGIFSMQYYVLYVLKIATLMITDPSIAYGSGNYYTLTYGIKSVKDFWDLIITTAVKETDNLFTFKIGTIQIMLIFDLVFVVVLEIGIMIYGVAIINHEKSMVANAFKAIPKRSITQIVQNLNQYLNRNIENDDEKKLDRQEENALRILSTANTTSKVDIKLVAYLIMPQIVYIIGAFIIFYILYFIPIEISNTMRNISPQLHDLIKAPTAVQSSIMTALRYSLKGDPEFVNDTVDYTNTYTWLKENCIEAFPEYVMNWWQSTGEGKGAFTAGDDYTALFSKSDCTDTSFLQGIIGTISCASIETSSYAIMRMLSDVFELDPNKEDKRLSMAILWLHMKLMEQVVTPGISIIEDVMVAQNDKLGSKMKNPIIIMIVIIVILGFYTMYGVDTVSESTLGTIKLFLQADPKDVMNSKTILKILSNDFSPNEEDSSNKDSSFYEQLVSNLPDGCIFMDNTLKILSANSAVENILGIPPTEVIGKNFNEVICANGENEGETSLKTFISALNTSMNNQRSPRITMEAEMKRGSNMIMVEFNVIAVSLVGEVQISSINREGLAMVIIVMKDTTQAMAAKRLLDEEHDKGEHLLKMILPDRIVKQLQRGDSNISFAVPSASILFMDIVSFTPWCGSLDAKTVMSTLNKMFKMFDTSLSRYDKMIKIKCIGDCYMAAGGVFDEVNNPAIHAKQAISFCLDAINGLSLFDLENKQQMRIRAGINCGGPIIAGVLGIEKPTFDILGSAISVAASMEHNGVPMNVHIPQHMYDLVYDQEFVFKERGEINIKEKMIKTYLVSGYTTRHD
ncbi:Adenylate and Guanylate cyclase catalytic domain containing protein [Trichomonas vaginalis G3]|uniref:Adenylate and Guanylate cyclase catalytic domain containing protein n=1 Tax=Trichomonas vaginalis (strain ATCC PRA-98 / G3) TaxID=412133 RepID=A2EZ90_TRIV3|nr:guanylate cyclase protein [Trichomonas vaginalis G3]EAY02023.1 Adenylate and Guanylate cyclase catalytic domain containing protein [Trichomonas vaginalis G3]KAI5496982.1 guanylate cyclase protein [Trichomonas vaginalis G3]|eukprot:XP_001330483.1 Adenylate and Guanylate cyclase catalytic domain containing protein [Trichomonas vaginalis G3]